jgi:hypothetical protein
MICKSGMDINLACGETWLHGNFKWLRSIDDSEIGPLFHEVWIDFELELLQRPREEGE